MTRLKGSSTASASRSWMARNSKGELKMVTTICYNTARTWRSREEAIEFFKGGIVNSDGAEKNRYINILMDLLEGKYVATDSDK